MILRGLASLVVLGLLALNLLLPSAAVTARGPENRVRSDVASELAIGRSLPPLELQDLQGRVHTREDLLGHRVLLTFERSVDWCPFTKARLVELRRVFEDTPDLRIVWVMAESQINERSRLFIDELGLANRILFLADPKSELIRTLGILKQEPEAIEQGVPHPTTLLLDAEGIVRFVDVREDFHFWLDPEAVREALSRGDW